MHVLEGALFIFYVLFDYVVETISFNLYSWLHAVKFLQNK